MLATPSMSTGLNDAEVVEGLLARAVVDRSLGLRGGRGGG